MLQKALRAIGWIAAGFVALVVVLYLGALAINWRDREPSAMAVRLNQLFRDRPAVADDDNGYIYLQRWKLDPDRRKKLPVRVQVFLDACRPGQTACGAAFDAADGLLDEWQAADASLADRYAALTARRGWHEHNSFSLSESLPPYSGAVDGQRLLLLRARQLAIQGDGAAVRALLEHDLQFWRNVLQSADTLITKMIATMVLHRHFEWGNLVLRKLPTRAQGAAIPDGWRSGISDAERSMKRCLLGEWMFTSEMLQNMDTSELATVGDPAPLERVFLVFERPMFQLQDTTNRAADHYWQIGQTFEVPLDHYEDAMRRADDLTERTTTEAATARGIYNLRGVRTLGNLSSFSQYAARVGDIEGVRRAALLAATLRVAGIEVKDMPAAVADAELRSPYNDRPFNWDETNRAIVFRGLEKRERGEHRIDY